ncbi:hypothetical protein [Idiomarina loihiensis]|uniref:hypothetical protein n=1 Tax=Idiomarina loihiensis TaxID=135577 RepID=UPI003158D373
MPLAPNEIHSIIKDIAIAEILPIADNIDLVIEHGGMAGGCIKEAHLIQDLLKKENYRVVLGMRDRLFGQNINSDNINVREHFYLLKEGESPLKTVCSSINKPRKNLEKILYIAVAPIDNEDVFKDKKWIKHLHQLALFLEIINLCEYCEYGCFSSIEANSKRPNFIECSKRANINEVQRTCHDYAGKRAQSKL